MMMPLSDDKYIFISYAHKDSSMVLPIISGLRQRGFSIWYDRGIEAGSEWPAYIEEMLSGCDAVIAFVSENAGDSIYCRKEITYAIKKDKKMLVVYLEELKKSNGLDFLLTGLQSMYRENFSDDESFLDELSIARILQACRKMTVTDTVSEKAEILKPSVERVRANAPEAFPKKAIVGKKTYPDGCVYEGELVDDEPNGKGVFTKNGFVYEGNFLNGKLNGTGKIFDQTGFVMEGDFVENKLHGKGKKSWKNGTVHEGEFVANELHGTGKKSFEDGTVYEGEFINGSLSKGKCITRWGYIEEGEFLNGSLNGKGKITSKDGNSFECEFVKGALAGKVRVVFSDNFVYEGYCIDGVVKVEKNGTTVYIDDKCGMYEGEVVNSRLNGKGRYISLYGDIFEGTFYDNKLNGKGKVIRSDGITLAGKWENGKLMNGYKYDKDGKKIAKYVGGKKKESGLFGF